MQFEAGDRVRYTYDGSEYANCAMWSGHTAKVERIIGGDVFIVFDKKHHSSTCGIWLIPGKPDGWNPSNIEPIGRKWVRV